jgi:hypothetical protein
MLAASRHHQRERKRRRNERSGKPTRINGWEPMLWRNPKGDLFALLTIRQQRVIVIVAIELLALLLLALTAAKTGRSPSTPSYEGYLRTLMIAVAIAVAVLAQGAVWGFARGKAWARHPAMVLLLLVLAVMECYGSVVLPILVVLAVLWIMRYRASALLRHREQRLREFALAQGWSLHADIEEAFFDRYPAFSCLPHGSGRYAYHIVEGCQKGRAFWAFDFRYETCDSEGDTVHHYGSAVIVDAGVPLKPLLIGRERIDDKIAALFGKDDIDFQEAPGFSREFHVSSPERRWASEVLHEETRRFLSSAPRFTIEFRERHVLACRDGVFLKTNAMFDVCDIEAALEVLHGLLDRIPDAIVSDLRGSGAARVGDAIAPDLLE